MDRVGRASEFVAKPAITFGLTVQPEILHQVGENTVFTGRGLLARFLWSVPDSSIGFRPVNVPDVPGDIVTAYEGCLWGLDTVEDGMRLHLSDPALEGFTAFREATEVRLRPDGDLASIQAWANKHPGQILRIAALLHLVEHGPQAPERISIDSVHRRSSSRRI